MAMVIRPTAGGCWLWRGHCDRNGYGQFWLNGMAVGAHRASFALFNGRIHAGMEVDHLCDSTACVNPDHLCLKSKTENSRDGARRRWAGVA